MKTGNACMQKSSSTDIPALWSGSVAPARASVAVAPVCQVEARCEAELTLQCGDGSTSGLVQYWHTPFGDLQPGLHSELEPVHMQHEGNLVLSNISSVHSGLYYCLLQHADGITLWPHQLRVSQESSGCKQPSSRGAGRSRRDAGPATERQGAVSDGLFTGAVVGSVLLTFAVGFSAGALCRGWVLRCLEAVIARLRSPRAQRNDVPDYVSEVSMTTLSPVFHSHVVEMEQAETMTSSAAPVPPAKPQRSFREKRPDDREIVDHLKGCGGQAAAAAGGEDGEESMEVMNQDFKKETEQEEEEKRERRSEKMSAQESNGDTKQVRGKEEGGEGGRCLEEKNHVSKEETGDDEERGLHKRKEWCDEEREGGDLEELNKFSDGETEFTPIPKTNEEIDEQVRNEGEEKKNAFIEEKEGNSDQENRSREGEPGRRNKGTDGFREEEERWREEREYDGETDSEEEEEEEESPVTEEPPCPPAPRPGRPSRVIRLYQYDEEGQLYSHVPQPGPGEPGPAPRLQQRSISLTRLSTIMAAASAGPLDPRGTDRAETSTFPTEM